MEDVTNEGCDRDGAWYNVCGDACLGPPGYAGTFFGEMSMICRCPNTQHNSSSSLVPDDGGSYSCPVDFPVGAPFPWDMHRYPTVNQAEQVPQYIFPPEPWGEGSKGYWTWCANDDNDEATYVGMGRCFRAYDPNREEPCDIIDTYCRDGMLGGKPKYSSSNGCWCVWWNGYYWVLSAVCNVASGDVWILAPENEDCPLGEYTPLSGDAEGNILLTPDCEDTDKSLTDYGTGKWVFRGGQEQLGPPSDYGVDGRFYGETIAVGYCCGSSSSLKDDSESFSSSSLSTSCSMPAYPWFGWDDNLEVYQAPDNGIVGLGTGGEGCEIPYGCAAWLWCQCSDGRANNCATHNTVPYTDPGRWKLNEDYDIIVEPQQLAHGAPPILGRFFGEILWYCPCDHSESSPSVPINSSSCGAFGGCSIADTFTDEDDTSILDHTMDSGHSWTAVEDQAAFIVGSRLDIESGAFPSLHDHGYWVDCGSTVHEVSGEFVLNGWLVGLIVRGTGTRPDFIAVHTEVTQDEICVSSVSDGGGYLVYTNIYTYSMSLSAEQSLSLRCRVCKHRIKVWADGDLVINEPTTPAMFPDTGTWVGIAHDWSSGINCYADNFFCKIGCEDY